MAEPLEDARTEHIPPGLLAEFAGIDRWNFASMVRRPERHKDRLQALSRLIVATRQQQEANARFNGSLARLHQLVSNPVGDDDHVFRDRYDSPLRKVLVRFPKAAEDDGRRLQENQTWALRRNDALTDRDPSELARLVKEVVMRAEEARKLRDGVVRKSADLDQDLAYDTVVHLEAQETLKRAAQLDPEGVAEALRLCPLTADIFDFQFVADYGHSQLGRRLPSELAARRPKSTAVMLQERIGGESNLARLMGGAQEDAMRKLIQALDEVDRQLDPQGHSSGEKTRLQKAIEAMREQNNSAAASRARFLDAEFVRYKANSETSTHHYKELRAPESSSFIRDLDNYRIALGGQATAAHVAELLRAHVEAIQEAYFSETRLERFGGGLKDLFDRAPEYRDGLVRRVEQTVRVPSADTAPLLAALTFVPDIQDDVLARVDADLEVPRVARAAVRQVNIPQRPGRLPVGPYEPLSLDSPVAQAANMAIAEADNKILDTVDAVQTGMAETVDGVTEFVNAYSPLGAELLDKGAAMAAHSSTGAGYVATVERINARANGQEVGPLPDDPAVEELNFSNKARQRVTSSVDWGLGHAARQEAAFANDLGSAVGEEDFRAGRQLRQFWDVLASTALDPSLSFNAPEALTTYAANNDTAARRGFHRQAEDRRLGAIMAIEGLTNPELTPDQDFVRGMITQASKAPSDGRFFLHRLNEKGRPLIHQVDGFYQPGKQLTGAVRRELVQAGADDTFNGVLAGARTEQTSDFAQLFSRHEHHFRDPVPLDPMELGDAEVPRQLTQRVEKVTACRHDRARWMQTQEPTPTQRLRSGLEELAGDETPMGRAIGVALAATPVPPSPGGHDAKQRRAHLRSIPGEGGGERRDDGGAGGPRTRARNFLSVAGLDSRRSVDPGDGSAHGSRRTSDRGTQADRMIGDIDPGARPEPDRGTRHQSDDTFDPGTGPGAS